MVLCHHGRHKHGEWYARLCIIFSSKALGGRETEFALVKYFEETTDNAGTMMPRVKWATRTHGRRTTNWFDIVEARSVLRPVFLQRDYRYPEGLWFFVNTFVT